MAKFILGLLVGLLAGFLISPNGTDMNTVVHDARSALGKHIPVND